MSRQFEKNRAETFGRDESRFTDLAPEPNDEQDADSHPAAAYAASCENEQNNANLDALTRGTPQKQKNITQIAGED